MEETKMAKREANQAHRVFNDLDSYRGWCVEYGYVFNEKDLYRKDSNWSLYQRWRHGDRSVRNNWDRDSERFAQDAERTARAHG